VQKLFLTKKTVLKVLTKCTPAPPCSKYQYFPHICTNFFYLHTHTHHDFELEPDKGKHKKESKIVQKKFRKNESLEFMTFLCTATTFSLCLMNEKESCGQFHQHFKFSFNTRPRSKKCKKNTVKPSVFLHIWDICAHKSCT